MAPLTRPAPRPTRRTREIVAILITGWTALLAATMTVAAIRGGEPSDAYLFLYTGMVVMFSTAASWIAWRWVGRAVPRPEPEPEAPATDRHHRGLTGEDEPPRRW